MKYTINGFSQQEALQFKKNVIDKSGKEKEIKIDCTDLLILRWFVDFYPNMMKVEIDGRQYAWVQYKKLLQDLPLLDIKKQALFDRFQKMCEFEMLTHKTVKAGGSFSYYGFGRMYSVLIDTESSQVSKGEYSTNEGVSSQVSKGEYSTNEQINTSIKDTSTIDSNKKERKTSYDAILSGITDTDLKALYLEYIKMRKLIKAPLTDRALEMLINKVNKLEPDSIENQKQMLETAIMNNWKSVYPIRKEANNVQPNNKRCGDEYAFLE